MPRGTVARWAGTAVPMAVLVLAGCTASDGPDPAGTAATAPADAPESAGPGPGAEPTPAPEPAPDPTPDAAPDAPADPAPRPEPAPDPDPPGACDDATRAALSAVLTTQLDALAVEDFAGAYAVTSPFFRNFFTPEAFETLIRDEYPTLVGNLGHRFDECGVVGRRGFLVVGVRATDGTGELVLRYDLSEEGDGWRIDGALALPAVTLPPDPLV